MQYYTKNDSHRIRIPDTNDVAISTDYFWFCGVECVVPLDVQYWATIPIV